MANTYTQIHIHAVFAVRNRECLIKKEWKVELYKYMTAIIQNNNHKVLVINGVEDHVHILFGMRPTQALSELMQMIKGDSSKWINQNKLTTFKFSWQEGFGAFSYSKSHVGNVVNYINNQEQHHKKKSFHEEYMEMLKKYEVDFDPNYIFKPI
ncbi:MAG: IS200/IS605 family transposase [Saprospiraceae bacterium]|nr:IS200/IS605 family transposase [Saprospiraceae bacterium]MBK8633237.1 IS200/IS605 family transposase [Saprospiraceae bacterium]MBP7644748.1 IS200/IS605 family transposase [Saprospiraceae bacterium]